MKSLQVLAGVVGMVLVVAVCPAVAAVEAQIMLTIRVFQMKVDEAPEVSILKDVPILKDLPLLPAGGDADVRVSVGGGELDRLVREASEHCVSAPRIFTRAGQAASVRIGREVPGDFMQPTADPGVFRLVRGEPRFEGMRFEVTAEAGKDGGVDVRRFSMTFDQMTGREKVEGTELEVGAPIMKSRQSTHALELERGQRALLATSALDGSGETLLVVLEAVVVEETSQDTDEAPRRLPRRLR
jgi:hypothetical protein